jgi:hypothetical protein
MSGSVSRAVTASLRRWRDEVGDASVLGRVRLAVGLFLFLGALRAVRELQAGYFGDVFHWPILPEVLVPSRAAYTAIVVAQLLLAVLVVAGHRARGALALSAILGGYVLLCDRLQYHNNRYALFLYALLLSLSPCDRTVNVGAQLPRTGPMWAARLAGVQVSIVYLASGGSKLLDADWRSGQVLLERFHLYGAQALDAGVPQRVLDWFARPEATSGLAKLAIATELMLAVGLWVPGTRVMALWWGVWFHLVIEATSRVEGFTWLTLAMYGVFVTPDVRARRFFYDRSRVKGRVYARLVLLLDWLARFEVKAWEPDAVRRGHSVVVVRRDGSLATGVGAFAMVARCTPLLFPLWAPLALVASFTDRGDASAQA